jgi:PmbA protein
MELSQAVELAVDAAVAAGAGDAEAYAQREIGREVRVFGGEVESLTAATSQGVGVRVWIGARAGYAFGTELSERSMSDLAARAVTAAELADEDENAVAPRFDGDYPALGGLRDDSISSWGADRVVELALGVERAAIDAEELVAAVETAVYADSDDAVAIRSSTGESGSKETGLGFGMARSPDRLDPEAIGAEGAERAAAMTGASKPASRSCPVVFDPTVAASFAGLIGGGLSADAVQRGRSPFGQLLGETVASPALIMHDDGLASEGLAASPCDDEGIPRARTALIDDGRLQTFLYDSYTAHRGGVQRGGNASRAGYRSPPGVGTSNLTIASGELSTPELLAKAGEGVFVSDVAGLHSGVNPVNGTFSVGASGRLIKGGELAEPVREFTIASDLVSMLRAVRAVGADSRWVPFGGSVRTPSLLVGEMTVAGS